MKAKLERFKKEDQRGKLMAIVSDLRRVSYWSFRDFGGKRKLFTKFLEEAKDFLKEAQKMRLEKARCQKLSEFFDKILILRKKLRMGLLQTERDRVSWSEEVLTLSLFIERFAKKLPA